MKREIKFRALSMCKGDEWVYGDLCHYARNPHTEKWTIHDPSTGLETDIDETTIGQFTGLYDKNGMRIYEGDILSIGEDMYVCEFVDGGFEFRDKRDNLLIVKSIVHHTEVIGNIHDNKDLL